MSDNNLFFRRISGFLLSSNTIMLVAVFLVVLAISGFRINTIQDFSNREIKSASDTGLTKTKKLKTKFESKPDGDELYRQNCNRCHQPPQRFSKEQYTTILKHMRTIANFTEEEQNAILEFLTR